MRIKAVTAYRLSPSIEIGLAHVRNRLKTLGVGDFGNIELERPATHLLKRSGKMLRPILVLASAEALGKKPDDFVGLAVAVELLHTSSLLHDDIIDGDIVRRGMVSVHKKYGNGAAIIAGDALISKAVQESCRYGTMMVELVSRSAMKMCEGEILDYNYQKSKRIPNLRSYMEIAALKSGSLVEASASSVAKYSGSRLYRGLCAFGRNIGIGFQIRDDIIDSLGLDSGNGATEGRFRPNIVNTLAKHSRLGKDAAISEAVRLNNYYVDRAVAELGKIDRFGQMCTYANTIKLGHIR